MGAVPLKRVRGVAIASIVLVAASAALSVVELLVRRASRSDARRFEAGELTSTEFLESIIGYAILGVLIGLVTLAAAVLSIIWTYRVAWNLRALNRRCTWGPGWAIGGWFTPPVIYVVPMLMLRQFWQASDPDVPIGGDWRSRPSTPLPFVWFAVYSIGQLVVTFGQSTSDAVNMFGGSEQDLADQILAGQSWALASAAVTVVAAAVWVVLVRSLTDRHRRLTGEAGHGG